MAAESLPESDEKSFAETALELGGKSADEARRTGAIDKADDQVEQLFKPEYQTTSSPVHRAVWDATVPAELFLPAPDAVAAEVKQVMDDSLAVVQRHRQAGTLLQAEGKTASPVLEELGSAGYWGLLVERVYGGSETSFRAFASFLTRMATIDPTIAGLASVHGCIGAVDPLRAFGTPEQKRRWLPELASGRRLSAFALTEPAAGSDLTALRTRATRSGDHFLVTGEKLFITNVTPGRTIGLVCLIEEKPAVLIVDLPDSENERFQLVRYGLHALKHTFNRGIKFRDFPVPAENLLNAPRGNGLTIAYHGLNLGRVALCANAAGTMRVLLASMLPWAHYRITYGEAIEKRELVRRRMGRLAGLIVACDALTAWCATLLDRGYRGEMECIVAKIFGSEALKEAAVELCMKTHGGRSFLQGHLIGDNIHEYLAPCIYEGEGEMLGMAFFKSLIKQHGTTFFEPVGKALQAAGIVRLNPLNPAHLWALRGPLMPYAGWYMKRRMSRRGAVALPGSMPAALAAHARYAHRQLQAAALEISRLMRRFQLKLADRQCRMAELSSRVQKLVVMLVTALYAGSADDVIAQQAADVLCLDLRRELTGRRPSDRDFRLVTRLGATLASNGWKELASIDPAPVLMPY
jgi:alkylation response protein AidB-like acyl-CoA dehydrogenase